MALEITPAVLVALPIVTFCPPCGAVRPDGFGLDVHEAGRSDVGPHDLGAQSDEHVPASQVVARAGCGADSSCIGASLEPRSAEDGKGAQVRSRIRDNESCSAQRTPRGLRRS